MAQKTFGAHVAHHRGFTNVYSDEGGLFVGSEVLPADFDELTKDIPAGTRLQVTLSVEIVPTVSDKPAGS